jgi:hypothetical protein
MHHVTDHTKGGPTRVDNAALTCRHHHHKLDQGWQLQLTNSHAAWIPPPTIDKNQKPRYNHLHRPDNPR